ncbi:MAG: exosortase-associated EpsI family protein [Verrucomicrobiota bacterium]
MRSVKKWGLWAILIIAIVISTVAPFVQVKGQIALNGELPFKAPLVVGRLIPLEPIEQKMFSGAFVEKRLYQVAGAPVVVTLATAKTNRNAIHDPLFCYRGAGWNIIQESDVSTQEGKLRIVELLKEETRTSIAYWYSNGEIQYTSPIFYWFQTFLRRLTLGKASDEPWLIFVQSVEPNSRSLVKTLNYFPDLMKL